MWELFVFMKSNQQLELLCSSRLHWFRDEILSSALADPSRLSQFVEAAHQLLERQGYRWPRLYMKIMHHLLDKENYGDTVRWHMQLSPHFPPETEVFGALLSSFVVNPSPNMQSNLTALYVASTERTMYDHVVPVLFAAGLSKLARMWRRKFLMFGDAPITNRAKAFVRFMSLYFPSVALDDRELKAAGLDGQETNMAQPVEHGTTVDHENGPFADAIVARWFASTWTSVEFAINLVQRLGLRVVGPRALQSLALRDPDPKVVSSRIAHIQHLGVDIAPKAYCRTLAVFAQHGEADLLLDLLGCDIHPDEFEDLETRQMLMAASVRERDWAKERLLEGVEWALEASSSSRRLNTILSNELTKPRLDRARRVLDRMEALKVDMEQESAVRLLNRAFNGIGTISTGSRGKRNSWRPDGESPLERAIDVTRRVALHDVAIPVHYWKTLIYHLGRLGRVDELEQLVLEIVQLYSPPFGGLVPVHHKDLPQTHATATRLASSRSATGGQDAPKHQQTSSAESGEESGSHDGAICNTIGESHPDSPTQHKSHSNMGSKTINKPSLADDIKGYIPADLPFSHRQHPVQKLFSARLQRSIIQLTFDSVIQSAPSQVAVFGASHPRSSMFDVASGVRLLAVLRDQGVLVDEQVVRSTAIARISLAQIPSRGRHRSRDAHELSLEHMKHLFEAAWGTAFLPGLQDLTRHLDQDKPRLWTRYQRLFHLSHLPMGKRE